MGQVVGFRARRGVGRPQLTEAAVISRAAAGDGIACISVADAPGGGSIIEYDYAGATRLRIAAPIRLAIPADRLTEVARLVAGALDEQMRTLGRPDTAVWSERVGRFARRLTRVRANLRATERERMEALQACLEANLAREVAAELAALAASHADTLEAAHVTAP
ncbi:hypothetical protein JYK14_24565 [Siccirubricoccus sp. KC 17139]|uniref:CarD-like/TRCF RNAP-interacting domain-containing protein n=1 Tax=Siccirubricoccus soli TaxID=2899147 RepID=A0ABT1DDN7_9PROT|nr:hypothetical protein [Siccirubricoccus soli]MCO6419309.1 hypothetical protein [Siccirubricoccus soli]MCP2685444.1 hypothetical protein [Siccirubricoccus soli]